MGPEYRAKPSPDAFLIERSAGAGTSLRVLSVSGNLAIRRNGEKVLVGPQGNFLKNLHPCRSPAQ
jgi:hypothetical protein